MDNQQPDETPETDGEGWCQTFFFSSTDGENWTPLVPDTNSVSVEWRFVDADEDDTDKPKGVEIEYTPKMHFVKAYQFVRRRRNWYLNELQARYDARMN